MTQITINGQSIEVPENTTVLEAARQVGIIIPTLCDHPDLTPYGGCRLCVVEVAGSRLPATACTLPVAPGMIVRTETPRLRRARQTVLKLLLSMYYDSQAGRKGRPTTELEYWARKYQVSIRKNMAAGPHAPIDSDPNPFIRVDLNKCILCTRCVRACAEVQGRFVWSLAGRGIETRLISGPETDLISARCESCGACVAYCPTGALDNKMSAFAGIPDRKVTTICGYCGVGCQLDLNVKDNRIIRVTSNLAAPVNGMALCVKGRYGYDYVHHPERIIRPRVRRYLLENRSKPAVADPWVETDWDTALDITARKLSGIRRQAGPDSVGVLTSAKCTNEENYLMNKFARQVIGTHSIDHCARL
jgi:formate dehydrogenase major subunit/formate dehydrogenase alpha subunit